MEKPKQLVMMDSMEEVVEKLNSPGQTVSHRPSALSSVYVIGTYYEVGYEVGKRFRKEIDKFYKAKPLFQDLLPYYHTPQGRQLYEEYLEIVKDLYPNYVREMEGLADGAGRPFHEVFLIHIEPEMITMLRASRPHAACGHCTTVMLNYKDKNGKQQTVLAHNEESSVRMPKSVPYMVHAKITADTDIPFAVEQWTAYCYPGHMPGNCFSMNSYGLALTTNRLFPTNVQRGKIPYYIAARALLACDTIDAAEEMVKKVIHHQVALGFSATLAFSPAADTEQVIVNMEIAPADSDALYGNKNYDIKKIPVANKQEDGFYYHCNRFCRIPRVSEWAGEASSDHRKNRIEALAVPSCVTDVLGIVGDTGDKGFPIYRSGQYPDYLHTTATGVFDLMECTLSVYTNNPSNGPGPVMVLPMQAGGKEKLNKILS